MAGHWVEVAHTGTAGLEAARRLQPDVVLSDLGLPEMDGYELATTLRRDPVTARARLIAISGYGPHEDRRQSLQAGFDLHLTKPVDPAELRRILAEPNLAARAGERRPGPTGGSAEFPVLVQGSQGNAKGGSHGDKSRKGDQADGHTPAT